MTIEPQNVTPSGTTGAPTAYGVPLVIDATTGNVRALASGDTTVYGLLVRPFPTGGSQDPLATSTPPASGPVDVLRRGNMTVLLSGSTASTNGGQVYVWTAAAAGTHITGGFESTNPSSNGITLTGASFKGAADAAGNVEIEFNI